MDENVKQKIRNLCGQVGIVANFTEDSSGIPMVTVEADKAEQLYWFFEKHGIRLYHPINTVTYTVNDESNDQAININESDIKKIVAETVKSTLNEIAKPKK